MNALQGLNDQQIKAALHFEGPLLILAGAGSGKTRVLTNRIAWLISEKGVEPWHILAITFTNKAAGEMRDRVNSLVEYGADAVWVATFHSTCARILRRYIDCIGYKTNFAIYDSDDQKSLMKEVCKKLEINTKLLKEKAILSVISSAKDRLVGPEEFDETAGSDYESRQIASAYKEYQKQLKQNNALDFDDLIMKTVEVFEKTPEVLEQYRERFQFIMVDEYQDTNYAQFRLVSLLAGKRRNLCVVGDDDQSIYRFRGADIRNILDFETIYPDCKTIRLEQNYRSTQHILDAANAVISNNRNRKKKTLWTGNGSGEKVRRASFDTGFEEAQFIADDIRRRAATGGEGYSHFAVLYRTNAQSRLIEEKLLMNNIPYRIVGGVNFYSRREIKDLLSYLRTVDNATDDLAVRRIINIPKRGIGNSSITRLATYADVNGLSFYEALERAGEIPGMGRAASKADDFVTFIRSLRAKAGILTVRELLEDVIEKTGYVRELELEGTDEAKDRIQNIDELISKVAAYEQSQAEPTLSGFLEEVSLVADIDTVDTTAERVLLMTLHSAKGLEFPHVYIAGMEEGIFPSFMSVSGPDSSEGLEEERRLCYVGITRAMKDLTLCSAMSRMIRGQVQYGRPSRFLEEIPQELLEEKGNAVRFHRTSGSRFGSDTADMEDGYERRPFGSSSVGAGKAGYNTARAAFSQKAFDTSAFKVQKPSSLDYGVGDRVSHIKFREGTVLKIEEGAKDFEVTVKFDGAGVKKMYAAFAKLKKLS